LLYPWKDIGRITIKSQKTAAGRKQNPGIGYVTIDPAGSPQE
jgi:hypothetical protein